MGLYLVLEIHQEILLAQRANNILKFVASHKTFRPSSIGVLPGDLVVPGAFGYSAGCHVVS